MTQHALRTSFILLTLANLVSCGGAEGDDSAPVTTGVNRADQTLTLDGMILHDTCESYTQDKCSSCMTRARSIQQECRSACNLQAQVSGNFAFNCASSCDSTPASDLCGYACEGPREEPQCQRREFEFEITNPVDPNVRAACEAAVKRDDQCSSLNVGSNCALYGRVESPDVIPVYACLARTSCGSDATTCFTALPSGTLVEDLTAVCETEIRSSLVDELTSQGPWVLPQLRENALVCGERYCGTEDYEPCLWAWLYATVGL